MRYRYRNNDRTFPRPIRSSMTRVLRSCHRLLIGILTASLRILTRNPGHAATIAQTASAHALARCAADFDHDLAVILPALYRLVGHACDILYYAQEQANDINPVAGRHLGEGIDELSWATESIVDGLAYLAHSTHPNSAALLRAAHSLATPATSRGTSPPPRPSTPDTVNTRNAVHTPNTDTACTDVDPIEAHAQLVTALRQLLTAHADAAGYTLHHDRLWAITARHPDEIIDLIEHATRIAGRLLTIDVLADAARIFRNLTVEQEPGYALASYAAVLARITDKHTTENHCLAADNEAFRAALRRLHETRTTALTRTDSVS